MSNKDTSGFKSSIELEVKAGQTLVLEITTSPKTGQQSVQPGAATGPASGTTPPKGGGNVELSLFNNDGTSWNKGPVVLTNANGDKYPVNVDNQGKGNAKGIPAGEYTVSVGDKTQPPQTKGTPPSQATPGSSTSKTPQRNFQLRKVGESIYFRTDSYNVSPQEKPKLNRIADILFSSGDREVREMHFNGYADSPGSTVYNRNLTMRRAISVRDEMREVLRTHPAFVRSNRTLPVFRIDGRGEVPGGKTQQNRRVDVLALDSSVPTTPPSTPPSTPPKTPKTPKTPPPPPPTSYSRWFVTGGTPAMQAIRANCRAQFLIDGLDSFREMVAAIRTATSDQHYIYLLAWYLDDSFQMVPGDPASTVQILFSIASAAGVQIRMMLWDQWGRQNSAEVTRVNNLANGAAILDNRTLNYGSHHQKVLIVKGSQGLITFCGGVDINDDRINVVSRLAGSPMHDVHCKIKGPASYDLLNIFLERWDDHPNHTALDTAKGTLRGLSESVPAATGSRHYIQIARTYPNGNAHAGIARGPSGYSFAPDGEQTVWRQIEKGIQTARRFIYIEDQYLVSMDASRALLAALPNIQHLTILIPQGTISDLPQVHYRRREFIAPLRAAGGAKVRVFFLAPAGNRHTYVHAKMWVFDDEFAIIGSANCNRRGYSHDSEVNAGIFDASSAGDFAKRLRIELWAEHLNMGSASNRALLDNGVTSASHWLSPPAGAHVAPYDETINIERIHTDTAWNTVEDPDGS